MGRNEKNKLKTNGSNPWGLITSKPSAVTRQPVFMNSFLANILSGESFFHASPVHLVMRILLCFALKLSCHMFKFLSSSSHSSIALPSFAFICFPNPASIGWTLSVWFSGTRWMMALISFLHFLLLKSNIVSKYYFSWVEVPIPSINDLFTRS